MTAPEGDRGAEPIREGARHAGLDADRDTEGRASQSSTSGWSRVSPFSNLRAERARRHSPRQVGRELSAEKGMTPRGEDDALNRVERDKKHPGDSSD